MRAPRSIFWLNNARMGAENLGELGDPRITCVAMNAGDFKSDAEAERLGIMQYLYGGGAQGRSAEGQDPTVMAEASAKNTEAMLQSQHEHEPIRLMTGIEERAYVENAVISGHQVTEAERRLAGQMGAEFTGPSPAEITASGGSYQEAAEKAAQAQGLTGEPPKPEEPKPPESSPGTRSTPPPRTS